jgi:tetratricopeptide (TPR) repeat protein
VSNEQSHSPTLRYVYRFTFPDKPPKDFVVNLEYDTLALVREERASYPDWTRLRYHQCANCPLQEAEHERCPVAASLVDLVEFFGDLVSYEETDVVVEAENRQYTRYAPLQAECLLVRSQFGFFTNEADAMRRDAAAVIDLVDRTPNSSPVVRVDALSALAHAYQMNREFRKADETYAQCMKALEAMGRDRTLVAADTLNNWGLLHFRGDLSKAEALTRRVLELHRSIEGSSVKPGATSNYAGVLLRLRRYPESAALYEESIRSAVARNDVRAQMDNMIQLGLVYIESGELQRGSDQLDKLAPFKKLPAFGTYRQAQLAFARGRLARKRGDSAGAKARFLDAKAIYDALPNKIALTNDTLIELAYLELDQGELSAARATADQALAMAQSFVDINGPSFLVGLSLLARGDIERAQGAAETARASYRAAAEHLRTTLGADHPSTQEALRKAAS